MGLTERLDALVNRTETLADRIERALDTHEDRRDFYPFEGWLVERQEGDGQGEYQYKVHQASWWPSPNHLAHGTTDQCPVVTPTAWRAYLDAERHDKEHGCQPASARPPYTQCPVHDAFWSHVPRELIPVPMAAVG